LTRTDHGLRVFVGELLDALLQALQALELFLGCLCAFTKFTLAFLLLCTLGLLGVT